MLKIVSAHQPAFLPWLGLLHKLTLSDEFIVMDLAKFRKREFIHRNIIEINKQKNFVGLKINDSTENMICQNIYISKHHINNLEEIKDKIKHTYKKFEYFDDLELFIDNSFDLNKKNLVDICLHQLNFLKKQFRINTKIKLESEILNQKDLLIINNATDRLLKHAIITSADVYVTGINSLNYLDKKIFEKNKIINHVQKFNYDYFLKYQNIREPLSIIHQIAKIGYKNIKELILNTQETKSNLLNIYD